MKISLKKIEFVIFDCDGVILDTNKIKTEAFKKTLNESYYYHTNTNTSELISTITTNTEATVSVISSLLQL